MKESDNKKSVFSVFATSADKKRQVLPKHKADGKPLGIIPHYFGKGVRKVYRLASNGTVGKFFSSYDKAENNVRESFVVKAPSRLYGKLAKKHKRVPKAQELPKEADGVVIYDEATIPKKLSDVISGHFNSSHIISFFANQKRIILQTSMSCYGIMFFAFSLAMLAVQSISLATRFFDFNNPLTDNIVIQDTVALITYCVIAFGLLMLSLPFIIVSGDKSFISTVFKSKIIGSFLINVMGLREFPSTKTGNLPDRKILGFLIGALVGLSTAFVAPSKVLISVIIVIAALITLSNPEVGVLMFVFVLPFLYIVKAPMLICSLICAFIFLSAVIGVLSGKRNMNFKLTDISVFAFLLIILLSGIFSAGGSASFSQAIKMCLIALIYFVISSLMKSWFWIRRLLISVSASSFLISALAFIDRFLESFTKGEYGLSFVNNEGFSSVFNTPAELAVFMAVSVFITFAYISDSQLLASRFAGFIVIIINVAALVMTSSVIAMLALTIGFCAYFIIKTPKSIPFFIFALALTVIFSAMLPDKISNEVNGVLGFADDSVTSRLQVWKYSSKMALDNIIGGIGVGKEAFAKVYSAYNPSGYTVIANSRNLYLQILIETGIAGAVAFAYMIILLARSCFTLFKRYGMHTNACKAELAVMCGVLAMLIIGFADYIWSSYIIYVLFWVLISTTQAIYRRQITESYTGIPSAWTCDIEYSIKPRKNQYASPFSKKSSKKENAEPPRKDD